MMELKVDLRHPKVTKNGRYFVLGGWYQPKFPTFWLLPQINCQHKFVESATRFQIIHRNSEDDLVLHWSVHHGPLPPPKNRTNCLPVSKPSKFEKVFKCKNSLTDSSRLNLAHISVTKELGMEALSFLFIVILTHLAIMANILGH